MTRDDMRTYTRPRPSIRTCTWLEGGAGPREGKHAQRRHAAEGMHREVMCEEGMH